MTEPIHFCVVGTQRTGTTFLRTSLDSHSQIRCAGELFVGDKWPLRPYCNNHAGQLDSYQAYMYKSMWNWIGGFIPPLSLRRFLNLFYSRSSYNAVGFKLMLSEAQRFPAAVRYINERNISIIHMVRLNVLRTYISRLFARRTGVYHTTALSGELKTSVEPIRVNTKGIIKTLHSIANEEREVKMLFRGINRYQKVIYESYIDHFDKQNRDLALFLSCDAEELSTPLKRLHDSPIERLVANFGEIESKLINTQFEYCLT